MCSPVRSLQQATSLSSKEALPASSQAYSYYRPEWKGESLGVPMNVGG